MAKIVIVAPSGTDLDDAVKLLKNNGNEVDIEEPTPKAMLHMVLGLLSPSAYGFGSAYAYAPGGVGAANDFDSMSDAGDGKDDKEDGADDNSDDAGEDGKDAGSSDDDFNFEDLITKVDGEQVPATRIKSPISKLIVESLEPGPRAVYTINESKFAFWPANVNAPSTRVQVECGKHNSVLEIYIEKGDKTVLQVGDDLADIFPRK
jgi:hypothetical protein